MNSPEKSAAPVKAAIHPKDLDWLAKDLKLSDVLSESSDLESVLSSLPFINLEVWPTGRNVLNEGEGGDDFFVVYEGELSVHRKNDGAAHREIGRLKQGDFFGEIGFLIRAVRSATVRTESPCRLFRFPSREFADVLKRHKNLESRVKQTALERIGKILGESAQP